MMLTIRPAQKSDSRDIARLILLAIEELQQLYTGTGSIQKAEDILAHYTEQEVCRFSYHNVLLAEMDGEAAGAALLYPTDHMERLDAPIYAQLRSRGITASLPMEGESGEVYLDSLAVYPAYQGKGVGGKLLQAAKQQTAELGYAQLTLLVDQNKPRVKAIYERAGFVQDKVMFLDGHAYDRMIFDVKANNCTDKI